VGRLKTAPSRLGQAPQRFRQSGNSEADRSRERDATQPWRKWYKTARWQKLRRAVLKRDKYKCQQTGILLIGRYPAPNSPVADHIKPHRGNSDLFFDINNIQAVSKSYHDGEKQRQERKGFA
jgi:5-methylcytosine-specific restriction enzyme A